MNVTIKRLTSLDDVNRAAEMTTHGQPCKAPLRLWYKTKHSPIRLMKFWIELLGIPTFVSVHFVRHKIGVEHFVQSMRPDRGGAGDEVTNRLTPVNHGMEINAEALMTVSRKRLCYKASQKTVAIWSKVRWEIAKVDPDLASWMVPECVAIGYCPEFSECKPGLKKVLGAYADAPVMKLRKSK